MSRFEETLSLGEFTGGLNTKQRPNKIAINEQKSILSMDFTANSMRRAKGYEKLGTEDDDDEVGKTLYKHIILAGQNVLVKTIGGYIKFLDTVDDEWYVLTDTTFTEDLRWSFFSFNSYLYGQNGTDDWIFWKGSTMTTLDGAISIGDTTIDVQTGKGAGFGSSGTVMIQGEAITFTGRVSDQLTGCTIAVAHPDGSTIVLKLDSTTYTALEQANQVAFYRNRSYMIDTDTPTIIRHSKLADNTNPETDIVNYTIAGSGAGDAGFGIAPDEIVSLQVIIDGNQSSMLAGFCKNGTVYAFVVTDGTLTTVNAFIPARVMNSYPVARQLVAVVENDTAIIDQFGHIRTLGYGDVNTPLRVQTISQKIEPSLEAMDFKTDGAIAYYNRKMYATGISTGKTSNDITFLHDSNYSSWGAYGHWDVNDFALYNDGTDEFLVGLSVVTGNVWKLNTGYNANGGTYYSEMQTGDLTWGYPHRYKSALKMRMTGFITNNCNTYIDLFFDNSAKPITFLINGDNSDILGNQPNVSTGTVVFGIGVFGGGLPGGTNRKEFTSEMRLNAIPKFLKMSMRIRIDDQEVDFEANDITIWSKLEDENTWKKIQVLQRT